LFFTRCANRGDRANSKTFEEVKAMEYAAHLENLKNIAEEMRKQGASISGAGGAAYLNILEMCLKLEAYIKAV
jgi:hypothetical protein